MTVLSNSLKTLAAARSIAAVNAARSEINRQAEAGAIAQDAAAALLAAARYRLDELAEAGDQGDEPATPPKPAAGSAQDDPKGYPATIVAASEKTYPDSGTSLQGAVEVEIDGRLEVVTFRVGERLANVRQIIFRAAGLDRDAQPEELIGRHVRAELGTWTAQSGASRTVISRWHPAETKPRAVKPAAPAAKPAPAWERDEAQRRPPRTAAARVRASIERAGGEMPDDEIPF